MTGIASADVIIVGSGPAGISAAWPLVEAGIRVMMLDASDDALPPSPAHATVNEWRSDHERWRVELGDDGPLAGGDVSPKFATLLARATLAGFDRAAGLDARNFFATGSLAAGGLSRIWGALAARYSGADLAAFGEYGDDIAASYDRIAERIGLSGANAGPTTGETTLTEPAARLLARHRRTHRSGDFALTTASNAVLATSMGDRQGCTACGLCLHGCSRGSIYHSASELPALIRTGRLDYRSGVRVERLTGVPGAHIVEGRARGSRVRFQAPIVVLAAGTLMTTSLALRRLAITGQPVRLHTNPVGGMAFVMPALIGAAMSERSFGLGQLFYTLDVGADTEAAGVFYGADTLPLAPIADRLPFTRRTSLHAARALAPALLLATGYLPGRFSDNRMVVENDGAAGRIRIDGNRTSAADDLLRQTFRSLARHARQCGAWGVPGSTQLLPPGADAHPASTLPMGADREAATDWSGELNGAAGIFVADGAALPLLSARHPTLTIMANADRIGRALARRIVAAPALSNVS